MEVQSYNGILLNRFVEEVDEHFICKICSTVVKNPKECSSCQDLMCTKCIESVDACPWGASPLVPKQLARYARMYYNKLQLRCGNWDGGWDFVGTIAKVLEHQPSCQYKLSKCQSVICQNTFTSYGSISRTVHCCSKTCKTIYLFQKALECGQEGFQEKFAQHMNILQTTIQNEIIDELSRPRTPTPQQVLGEQLKVEKQSLLEELNYRKTHFHPGKISEKSQTWTCCNEEDRLAVGCREI